MVLKKIVSVILIIIFLYNISGYYLAFNFWQAKIKDFMECQVKEKEPEDLILITVSTSQKNNLEWENGNEFRLNGKMYDVAYRKEEGNIIYFYCYRDSKEEHLFASLKKHIKNNIDNPASGKGTKNVLKNPISGFYTISEAFKISFEQPSLNFHDITIFPSEHIFIEFPSPPPRFI